MGDEKVMLFENEVSRAVLGDIFRYNAKREDGSFVE